jgi:hypothetical protein
MFFLFGDIISHLFQPALGYGKRAKTILPIEFADYPAFLVYEPAGVGLESLSKI